MNRKRTSLLHWLQQLLRTLLVRLLCQFKSKAGLTKATAGSNRCRPKGGEIVPIPRVKGLPVVGTLLDLIAAGGATQLHKYIDSRHRQYGPIFRERLGGTQDAVFVSSAPLMRGVFLHEGQYPQHPLPDAWTLYNQRHACQRGLFFMEGAEWLHNRRILNRLLLNGNLNWMDVHIESCTRQLVDQWRARTEEATAECDVPGSPSYYELPNLEQQLYRWSIEVLCCIMFGSNVLTCPKIQSALDHFTQIVHKVFEHSSRLMTFPPRLAQLLRLRIWRDFESNVNEVLREGAAIIDHCIGGEITEDGQLEQLEQREETLFNRLQAAEVPGEMIKRIFVDLVIAAGDTTAFSSQWALFVLSREPQLQCRLARERVASESQLLHGLIKESLRLYPVAPFIGRYLPQDAHLGDHFVEKDTLVLLSLYTAGRDASHFEQPERVLPERWCVGRSHGSLPFAIGQRSCIGRRVALKQLHSLLGKCTTQFEMQCLNEQPVDCMLRMVTVPDQTLRLALRPRSSE
ncbi:cytochrome P450 315a1, mitochondrial isoform X1 [Drosophila miranda]|uniref:cytochrome P450 315a1, mitochondrial isoform X1 n=1 Tax=Drosophila miranda TaxID=7229 RepID=UPI0007E5E638|nr:cytochrome P450 315a1, mitochondrial isoform X1 [Drosophila miranda]